MDRLPYVVWFMLLWRS